MARFPAGNATFPFRGESGDSTGLTLKTSAFRIDKRAVSGAEFLAFVKEHPRYARSRIPRLMAHDSYLRNWKSAFDPGPARNAPATMVSWHAAEAYSAARDERLATSAAGERAAATGGPRTDSAAHEDVILAWYARPATERLPAFGAGMSHA